MNKTVFRALSLVLLVLDVLAVALFLVVFLKMQSFSLIKGYKTIFYVLIGLNVIFGGYLIICLLRK